MSQFANYVGQSNRGESNTLAGSTWKTLVRIVLIALAIRLVASAICFAIYAPIWAQDREDHWTYSYETGRVARSLATGHGFSDPLKVPSGPTAWLPPVYPLVFAGTFKIFGIYSIASLFAMRVFNSMVSAFTCVPVFFIALRFNKRLAIWAAWAWAFFPHAVYTAALITWDLSLSALIMACLVWMTLELGDGKPMPWWVAYGAAWGFAGLTNATMLAAFPCLLGWLWLQNRSLPKVWILRPVVAGLACLVLLSPWVVRNYLVFHQPFLIKSNFWLEFNVGNSVHQMSFWNGFAHPDDSSVELNDYVQHGEVAYMAGQKVRAMEFLRHHFSLYLWLCVRRVVYVWTGFWSLSSVYLSSNADGGYRHIALITAYSIPFVFGLVRGFRRRKNVTLLLTAVLFSVPFATYVTHPGGYRHAVDPEIVVLAVYGMAPFLVWAEKTLAARWSKRFRAAATPETGLTA